MTPVKKELLNHTDTKGLTMNMIAKMFECSTAHITLPDNNVLEKYQDFANNYMLEEMRVIPHEYGWIINTGIHSEEDSYPDNCKKIKQAFSKTFLNLIKYAREQGCAWINLDRDAETTDDLPRFEW